MLTVLGDRDPIVPDGLRDIVSDDPRLGLVVNDSHLEIALEVLAGADLVALYVQRWQPWKETWTWVDAFSAEVDWAAAWPALVRTSLTTILRAASKRRIDPTVMATIEWIGPSDWVQA